MLTYYLSDNHSQDHIIITPRGWEVKHIYWCVYVYAHNVLVKLLSFAWDHISARERIKKELNRKEGVGNDMNNTLEQLCNYYPQLLNSQNQKLIFAHVQIIRKHCNIQRDSEQNRYMELNLAVFIRKNSQVIVNLVEQLRWKDTFCGVGVFWFKGWKYFILLKTHSKKQQHRQNTHFLWCICNS